MAGKYDLELKVGEEKIIPVNNKHIRRYILVYYKTNYPNIKIKTCHIEDGGQLFCVVKRFS